MSVSLSYSTTTHYTAMDMRKVWRYQRGNQNPYIEEEQTTQWPKEKGQKDKQRSTKHTYKTKDRVTRTPLIVKTGGELRCSGRVSSSCSTRLTSDTRRFHLVTNPMISHKPGKDREVCAFFIWTRLFQESFNCKFGIDLSHKINWFIVNM